MAKSQHARRYRQLPGFLRAMRERGKLTQRELVVKLKTNHVFAHKSEIGECRVDITEFMDWWVACGVHPEKAFRRLRGLRGI